MSKPLERGKLRNLAEKFHHLATYTEAGNSTWETCLHDAIREITQFGAERFGNAHDDLLAACIEAADQLRFYDANVTIKNHDAKLIASLDTAIAKAKPPRKP